MYYTELENEADEIVNKLKTKLQEAVIAFQTKVSRHKVLNASLTENRKYLNLLKDSN